MGNLDRNEKGEVSSVFLSRSSTFWVTLIRFCLIMFLHSINSTTRFNQWISSPSLLSVLIRPYETLMYVEESEAIRVLSRTSSFAGYYSSSNDSIRIPPLLLALLSPLAKANDPGLSLSMLLLLADISIAYLLEQIGNQFIKKLNFIGSVKNNDGSSHCKAVVEEDDLQRKLPDAIRPPNERFFAIHKDVAPDRESSTVIWNKRKGKPFFCMSSLPILSAQIYYFSPLTLLPTGFYYCWQNIPSLLLLWSFHESFTGSLSMASFYLAAASYLEPHYVIFLLPVILMGRNHSYEREISNNTASKTIQSNSFRNRNDHKIRGFLTIVLIGLIFFAVWSVFLQGISYRLLGPESYWDVIKTVYGETWLSTSPNLSLQWYFFMQMFSRFRSYFGSIFALFPFVLVGPISIRFIKYPEIQLAAMVMVWTIYRPVQVLFDLNVSLCFILLCPRSLVRMGSPTLFALSCIMVPLLLKIVDHWMWLDANNGNANYMFFQCLAYNVFVGIVFAQFASASMQRDKSLRIVYQIGSGYEEKLKIS